MLSRIFLDFSRVFYGRFRVVMYIVVFLFELFLVFFFVLYKVRYGSFIVVVYGFLVLAIAFVLASLLEGFSC